MAAGDHRGRQAGCAAGTVERRGDPRMLRKPKRGVELLKQRTR
jgi:hypothetical protein